MCFKISFGLILVFSFWSIQSFGQKTLYLKPFIGNQNMLNRYDRSIGKPEFLKINEINSNSKDGMIGLGLELKLNENWRISTGYSREWLRWRYRITLPESEKLGQANYSMGIGAGRANRLNRVPVVVKRTFLSTQNYQPNSVNKLSWFDVRLFVQGGLSFDFYTPEQQNLQPYPELKCRKSFYEDSIVVREKATILKRQGVSAITGVGTEIYLKGKPLFEVTLFYNQGLRNLIASNVNYQVNSLSGHTRIITRGSSFGTTLAIPIRLKTYKTKAES